MVTLPKISIVTPSYNQAHFLEETIKSLIDQNYPNLEYIIIDGGSTDNSVEIIKKYEKYITYWISERDKGQTDAIIKGLIKSTGEIFAWQNSDDRYLPGTFNYVNQVFSSNPQIDLLFGGWNFINEDGRFLVTRHLRRFSLMRLRAGSMIPPQPAVFFRTNAIKKVGNLNIIKSHVMDYDLYVRIARTDNVLLIDRVLGDFRIHERSKTVSDYPSQLKELIETRRDHFGNTAKWNERLYWIWIDIFHYTRYYIHDILGVFSFRDLYAKYLKKLKALFQK
jgi:glycosyltransferase involved in cell wall biosynthesis